MDSFVSFPEGVKHHRNHADKSVLYPDSFYQFSNIKTDYPLVLKPVAWWDNGDKYMAKNGSIWIDRVGAYNFRQDTPLLSPVYTSNDINGRPSFVFDGSTQFMLGPRLNAIQASNSFTIWAVGNQFGFGQDQGNDSGTGQNRTSFVHLAPALYSIFRSPLATSGSASINISSSYHYSVTIFDGKQTTNSLKIITYYKGVQQSLTFSGAQPTISETGETTILRLGVSGGTFVAGRCAEFGIIPRTISSSEATLLNSYLSTKYAL